jgi:biopolymer transport protein ExbD
MRCPPLPLAAALALTLAACRSDTPFVRAACEAGDAHACEVVAARLLLGTEGKPDEAEAARFHKRSYELHLKACAAGVKESCLKRAACGVAVAMPSALPLDTPRMGGGEIQVIFGVELHAAGALMVDGKRVEEDALLGLARAVQRDNPELRAVIRADAAVPHGRVIRVLDLLKQAGISRIAFGVSPVPAGSADAGP